MNASQRLDMTGAHLLRLQQALCRLPRLQASLDRFAELSADPAVQLSDLIERVLRGGPAPPAGDWPEAAPDRRPVAAPGSAPAVATRHEAHQAMRPGRRHPASATGTPSERRAAAGLSLTRPSAGPVQPASPPPERMPAVPADPATSAAGRAVSLPPATGPTGYRSKDAGAPAGGSPAAGTGTGPAMTRASRSPFPPDRLTAAGARMPQAASPHMVTAPGLSLAPERAGAASAPPGGARLASGFPDWAAALQANVASPVVPPTEMTPPRPETGPARAAQPSDGAGAAASGPRRTHASHEAAPPAPHEIEPYEPDDPALVAASDLRRLMGRITSELELELIRVYGTSGR